ncbi:MAG: hypothetical protein F4X35_03050 [Alphaproteobacteria bacterium]|nr:hypothetical protein [Alphaproteobacteria bacterium]
MTEDEGGRRKRPVRRETRYPRRLVASVSEDTAAAIERAADEAGVAVAAVVRECIEHGLPRFRERHRGRRRRRTGR